MPAPIKNIDYDEIYDPNQGDGTTPQDPDQDPGVGNGPATGDTGGNGNSGNTGGNPPKGPYGDTEDPEEPPTDTITNTFAFIIKSNQKGFSTFVNGNKVGIDSLVRITRESLARDGDKKITISKEGYVSNEYYIVSMLDDGAPIIENQGLKDNQLLGINTKAVSLIKYVDNKITQKTGIGSTTSVTLDFPLNKKPKGDGDFYEEPIKYKLLFDISGKGAPVNVTKNGKETAQFFPKIGLSEYEDIDGTSYTISSSNLTLYKITEINVTNDTQSRSLTAKDGESLELNIKLKSNYILTIVTEEVFKGSPALNPQIKLVNTDARTYNINSKSGVPLLVQMNDDVQAITVVVGDDVLEFDDFGRDNYEEPGGKIVGITIPHRVFNKIGQYNIKLFPFSFNDYEEQVRPVQKGDVIKSKKVETKFDIKEEVKLPPIDVNDKYNPYKPKAGSGGGRPVVLNDGLSESEINPFTNIGDFVNNPINDRNLR
jgi:hypothetical protein